MDEENTNEKICLVFPGISRNPVGIRWDFYTVFKWLWNEHCDDRRIANNDFCDSDADWNCCN